MNALADKTIDDLLIPVPNTVLLYSVRVHRGYCKYFAVHLRRVNICSAYENQDIAKPVEV